MVSTVTWNQRYSSHPGWERPRSGPIFDRSPVQSLKPWERTLNSYPLDRIAERPLQLRRALPHERLTGTNLVQFAATECLDLAGPCLAPASRGEFASRLHLVLAFPHLCILLGSQQTKGLHRRAPLTPTGPPTLAYWCLYLHPA